MSTFQDGGYERELDEVFSRRQAEHLEGLDSIWAVADSRLAQYALNSGLSADAVGGEARYDEKSAALAFANEMKEVQGIIRSIDDEDSGDATAKSELVYSKMNRLAQLGPLVEGVMVSGSRWRQLYFAKDEADEFVSKGSPFSNMPFHGSLAGAEVVIKGDAPYVCLVVDLSANNPHMHNRTSPGQRVWIPVGGLEFRVD